MEKGEGFLVASFLKEMFDMFFLKDVDFKKIGKRIFK